jgi:transaldolase
MTKVVVNPVRQLRELGQSVWLDELSDSLISAGRLERLIAEDWVSGITSNPTILEEAIGEDLRYQREIMPQASAESSAAQIYENLTVDLAQRAADVLRTVHERASGQDGFVSIEVSPLLADDAAGMIAEAERLWRAIERPNVMIKVPSTVAGLTAIRRLIVEGVNVNATLLFGVGRYRQVLDAFAAGLEERRVAGQPLARVASVASLFVSRIDTLVDKRLNEVIERGGVPGARALLGRAATAVARRAYQNFKQFLSTPQWGVLAAHGAHPQRLLWASTSTKNPSYSDVKYLEALIGPSTVTTVPLDTLAAFREHGRPGLTLEADLDGAATLPADLLGFGIDLERVSEELEADGVQRFAASLHSLLSSIAAHCGAA